MQERRATGNEGYKKGGRQERRDTRKEGDRKGGRQERRDSGNEILRFGYPYLRTFVIY